MPVISSTRHKPQHEVNATCSYGLTCRSNDSYKICHLWNLLSRVHVLNKMPDMARERKTLTKSNRNNKTIKEKNSYKKKPLDPLASKPEPSPESTSSRCPAISFSTRRSKRAESCFGIFWSFIKAMAFLDAKISKMIVCSKEKRSRNHRKGVWFWGIVHYHISQKYFSL